MAQREVDQETKQLEQQRFDLQRDPFQSTRGSVNDDGRLHTYCKKGKFKKVKGFIQTCKDLSSRLAHRRGVFGYTPVHEAVVYGHSNILELLLHHGGDPSCYSKSGYTPLYFAASYGHVNCVRVLLANNADITNRDYNYGLTPLEVAKLRSEHEVAKVLRSAGKFQAVYSVYFGIC